MIFEIEGKVVVTLQHIKGEKTVSHIHTDFNLDVSSNLDKSQYQDKDGLPTAVGSKTLTNAFVQGLIGNIHHAHDKGFHDSAEHLRYIIAELERGFAQVTRLTESTFTK